MAMTNQLMEVIQEMQAEINKLETENHALRMKLSASSKRLSGSEGDPESEKEEEATNYSKLENVPEQSPATQTDSVSSDEVIAVQEYPDNVMIVRRYCISSSTHSFAKNDPWETVKRYLKYGTLGSQGTVKSLVCSSIKKQEKEENMFVADYLTSQRPSSEHRDKIKTVSFLLPQDTPAYSKTSDSLEYSPNPTTNQLSTITE
ncbi:putative coiled-coil domain-containing protein 195 [Suncus etruscus]|uniref:putative coiled-coil domain-containing protein 195 n=1 Tax=Suncus etruscus TaxID=109475 RepID=UPI0021104AF5|nr:putative coiled-coil domain-containing protein 195 [Suncus etruscus]